MDELRLTPGAQELLNKLEVAEFLRTTPRHVESLVDRGEIAACRVGRFLRFRPDDIVAYLQRTTVATEAPR